MNLAQTANLFRCPAGLATRHVSKWYLQLSAVCCVKGINSRKRSGRFESLRDLNIAPNLSLQDISHRRPLPRKSTVRQHASLLNVERGFKKPFESSHGSYFTIRLKSDVNNAHQRPIYTPPSRGLLSCLPTAVVPYVELSRLDKPAGAIYLFFPCAFSTLLAAPLAYPSLGPLHIFSTITLFLSGAVVMRAAGCTINDLWDRNLDPHVARTRLRPIARGAIQPRDALVYTGAQLLTGLAILLQFPHQCLWYGIPSLALVTTYPLAKRVTNYPQVVLGLAFSWGAIMGFPALNLDLTANPQLLIAATSLYLSCVSWTVLYDMIYAHMDIKDDVKAGIKSIALRHQKNTKSVLTGLAVTQTVLLAIAGISIGASPIFLVGSCGGTALTLGVMIRKVNLKNFQSCWWWFRNGCWFTGGAITLGLTCEYLYRMRHPLKDAEDPRTSHCAS